MKFSTPRVINYQYELASSRRMNKFRNKSSETLESNFANCESPDYPTPRKIIKEKSTT